MTRTDTNGRRVTGVRAWVALWRATRSVEASVRQSVESSGLCLSDFGVLETLLHRGPLPVGELGRRVLLTSGSITTAIDRLERGGLVTRAAASGDRRSRIVHLTDAGRALIKPTFAAHARDMDRVFDSLTAAERDALVGILAKLGAVPDATTERSTLTAQRPSGEPAAATPID